MANQEWERLKETLKQAPTPEARRQAAEATRRYLATQPSKKSRPTLVSLNLKGGYPHAIPLDKIPSELERNPAFFELLKKIIK